MLKDKIASGLGSILEWYDFSLYGFFAPLIAQLYFPDTAQNISLLKTFAVLAIGFMARPLGALLFGYISDKYGRALCLKLTPLLITTPTLLIALLPDYAHIGFWAPLLLVVCRVLQGICIGGEYANNIVYLCETTHRKHLYLAGSIGSCTASFGILLASAVAAIFYTTFSPQLLMSGVWRFAFAISIAIGLCAYFIRKNIAESPIFTDESEKSQNPITESWSLQWKDYLLATGLTFLPATAFYFMFVFFPNYINHILGVGTDKALGNNSILLLLRLLIIPILALLADKIGGIKLARLSSILFIILSIPALYVITHTDTNFWYLFYILALLTTLNAATTPGLLVQLLPSKTRCTILSFTLNFCFGTLGGIVPFIGFFLFHLFGDKTAPAYYLAFAGIITLVATFFYNQRKDTYEKCLPANINR